LALLAQVLACWRSAGAIPQRRFCFRNSIDLFVRSNHLVRISARNQLKGTVTAITKGATTAHVKVDIGNQRIVTSSITNEAVDELGIKTGSSVIVVIKASDVMVAVN
jgi:molybdopterin-binding protein